MAARKLRAAEHLAPAARYQLLVHLASGGMGSVYLGVEKGKRDRVLAIKRAHSHLLEDPGFRQMFAAEARLASLIRHPNAIGVVDVDESDGELLMVMPYLEGGSLGDMLVAGYELSRRVPPAVVLRIVVDAARGLQAAHSLTGENGRPLGIVHRDVSPHNILVGVTGIAAIVDFGVAKAVAVESNLTATGVLKGKTAYMAPEYIGKHVATPQTDVFSLGIVCWEALANRRLFKGDTEVETMQHILGPTPAPMLTDETSTDANVAAIVARALVKDPTKRFHTAAEFADALERRAQAAEMLASPAEVAAVVKSLLSETIDARDTLLREALQAMPDFDGTTGSLRRTSQMGQKDLLPPTATPSSPRAQPVATERLLAFGGAPPPPGSAPGWHTGVPAQSKPTLEPTLVDPAERSSAQATFASVVVGRPAPPHPGRQPGVPRAALFAGAAVALGVGGLLAVLYLRTPSGAPVAAATTTEAATAERPLEGPAAKDSTSEPTPTTEPSPAVSTTASATATAQVPAVSAPPRSSSPTKATGGWRPKANPYAN